MRIAVDLLKPSKLTAAAFAIMFAFVATGPRASATTRSQNEALSTRIALEISAEGPLASINAPLLQRFYGARAFAPIWMTNRSGTDLVQSTLVAADSEGLNPEDYHASEIVKLADGTIAEQVDRELLLTDGLLKYAHDVRLGRFTPNEVDGDIDLPVQAFDPASSLATALQSGALRQFLADLPPPHPEYAALHDALKRYLKIAANGGWLQTPLPAAPNEAATASDQSALWERLVTEDSSLRERDPENASAALTQALSRFQERNGLPPDGKLGPRTVDALNVTAQHKIAQIAANMERWRWMPRAFEPDYVAVNVPDASLVAVRANQVALTSRVVVGRPSDPTPIVRTSITGVTVNPPWDVPMSIARREYLPHLKKDSSYLADHHIFIKERGEDPSGAQIAWSKMGQGDFNFHLRQAPGPDNALGRVKLEMPNKYSVYLHDTPNKTVFANDYRDLSHGCMRVDRIMELASVVLTGDATTESGTLQAMIDSGQTATLALGAPLPVYALYWTAFVNNNGEIQFRRDLYGRDERLVALMSAHSAEPRLAESQGCPVNAG